MQKISTYEVNKIIYVSNAVHAVEIIPFIWYALFLMRKFESQNPKGAGCVVCCSDTSWITV